MNDRPPGKWYFKTSSLIIALLCVGPLALPLAWANPRFNRMTKIGITLVVLALTYVLVKMTSVSLTYLRDYYKQVFG